MKKRVVRLEDRRRFLGYLAGSPLFAGLASAGSAADVGPKVEPSASPNTFLEALGEKPIASAAEAVNVFDFEVVARRNLPPAHYGYLATGVDDDVTVRANREGFRALQIRARHLVDVSQVDTATEIFGVRYPTPIVLAPAASQKAFHPEGEVAVAHAARTRGHLQILASEATASPEEVMAARGGPVWQQLYPTGDWSVTEKLVRRSESAGCPVLVLTVDLPLGSNRDTARRFARVDTRACASCHDPTFAGFVRRRPLWDGIDVSRVDNDVMPGMTWEFVKRLRALTRMRLVLKGIVTREDAMLALEQGVDGIVVSNHGGRSEESGRSTIESLPEVVEAVGGKMPVLVDSGFRRGTDIFKALALGARAICIGRPYLWGLAAFGTPGVEAVLSILRAELETVMRTVGTPSLRQITPASLFPASR